MRKLYLCSFLIGFFALACGMWSCSDDDSNNGDTTVIEVETPASDAIFATSATFNLKTKGAESYVYKVREFGIILKQNQLSCMFNGISLQCFRLIVIKAICCQCRNKIH